MSNAPSTFSLNGSKVSFEGGDTILDVANREGIEISTLCHVEGHLPEGVMLTVWG